MKTDYEQLHDGLILLHEIIMQGAEMEYDGRYWCLYSPDGDIISSGETLLDLVEDTDREASAWPMAS